MRTLWSLLEERAGEDGSRILLAAPGHEWTRGGLAVRAARIAAGLHSLGIHEGDRVAVFADNRLEHVELAFALNRLGASYAPINPLYRGGLLQNALETLAPAAVVVDPACRQLVQPDGAQPRRWILLGDAASDGLPGEVVAYDELEAAGTAPVASDGRREAMVLFTSGTTGPSKGVSMSSGFLLEVARANARAREVTAEDRLHSCFAFCHANPIGYTLLPALLAGASMAWTPRFSASGFWSDLRALHATQFSAFGAVFPMLLSREPADSDRAHGARLCFGVGAPRHRAAEFEERFGVRIVEGYGLSECGAITYQWAQARRLGSVGRPTPGWQVRVVDDDDESLRPRQVGEIVGRPDRPGLLMDGYIGRPEATLDSTRNLWFHTGDRGYFDDDGFLWFVDRKKDSMRRRGENISSFEVEEAIRATGLVEDCAAYPVASPLGEDEVMVAVVPIGGSLDPDALLVAAGKLLPSYAVPGYVRVVAELPRTPTGKVEKYKLREVGVTDDSWIAGSGRGAPAVA